MHSQMVLQLLIKYDNFWGGELRLSCFNVSLFLDYRTITMKKCDGRWRITAPVTVKGTKCMPKVVANNNESTEQLLRRFRKVITRSGVLGEVRRRRWHVPRSEERRVEKKKAARRAKRRDRMGQQGGQQQSSNNRDQGRGGNQRGGNQGRGGNQNQGRGGNQSRR